MALILYADDEERYRRMIALFLKSDGHSVITAENGREAFDIFGSRPDISLVILDAMMPVMDGWKTLKAIRAVSPVPVLMLTALNDAEHEVQGLQSGADDYIQKPFKSRVFLARVQAALRKTGEAGGETIHAGLLTIDTAARTVRVGSDPVGTAPKEFELLSFFARNPDIVLSRERILDRVWGFDYEGDPRTVDTHVKSLRAKLGASGDCIVTSRGSGYRFSPEGK
jgi:two-component system, OmpR family, response regulator ResD